MYATLRLFNLRTLALLALLLLVMAAAYGFAAANTVGESGAGDGTGNISGYAITNVQYTLKATDPRQLASVSFAIGDNAATPGTPGAPSVVKIAFPPDNTNTAAATWYDCATVPAALGGTVTCTFPATASVTVLSVNFLEVVAVD